MAEILVSACLAGERCRYDGRSNTKKEVLRWVKEGKAVPFCPEVAGGLNIPRPGAEIKDGRVVTIQGEDVTEQFQLGASRGLELCQLLDLRKAFLAIHSPSCGSGLIYDGSFSKNLIPGDGTLAKLLSQNGIKVTGPRDNAIIQTISKALKPLSKSERVGFWGRPWGAAHQGSFFGSHHLLGDEESVVDICQHRKTGKVVVTEYGGTALGDEVREVLGRAGLFSFVNQWQRVRFNGVSPSRIVISTEKTPLF